MEFNFLCLAYLLADRQADRQQILLLLNTRLTFSSRIPSPSSDLLKINKVADDDAPAKVVRAKRLSLTFPLLIRGRGEERALLTELNGPIQGRKLGNGLEEVIRLA